MIPIVTDAGKKRFMCEHFRLCQTSMPACPVCGNGMPVPDPRTGDSICRCGAVLPKCPSCDDGWLVERAGRYGAFLGCVNYPRCEGKRRIVSREDRPHEKSATHQRGGDAQPLVEATSKLPGARRLIHRPVLGYYRPEQGEPLWVKFKSIEDRQAFQEHYPGRVTDSPSPPSAQGYWSPLYAHGRLSEDMKLLCRFSTHVWCPAPVSLDDPHPF